MAPPCICWPNVKLFLELFPSSCFLCQQPATFYCYRVSSFSAPCPVICSGSALPAPGRAWDYNRCSWRSCACVCGTTTCSKQLESLPPVSIVMVGGGSGGPHTGTTAIWNLNCQSLWSVRVLVSDWKHLEALMTGLKESKLLTCPTIKALRL